MDINKIKYVLVGNDCVEPAISDDELINEFTLTERTEICAKCMYYERLVQTIKDEEKDWLFELCDYDLSIVDDIHNTVTAYENVGSNTYYGLVTKMLNDKKNTNITKMSDLDKKRYVTARDNLVNNFVNGNYSLEVIYKTFNDVTKTTNIKKIEYYAIDTWTHEYYDVYDTNFPKQRYVVENLRKIISEKIDAANNYEFDGSYLIYSDKKVILTLYV